MLVEHVVDPLATAVQKAYYNGPRVEARIECHNRTYRGLSRGTHMVRCCTVLHGGKNNAQTLAPQLDEIRPCSDVLELCFSPMFARVPASANAS